MELFRSKSASKCGELRRRCAQAVNGSADYLHEHPCINTRAILYQPQPKPKPKPKPFTQILIALDFRLKSKSTSKSTSKSNQHSSTFLAHRSGSVLLIIEHENIVSRGMVVCLVHQRLACHNCSPAHAQTHVNPFVFPTVSTFIATSPPTASEALLASSASKVFARDRGKALPSI